MLEAEIRDAQSGTNTWQDQIGTIIDEINASVFVSPEDLRSQLASVKTFNSRFVSAIPLDSARQLHQGAVEGRFTVDAIGSVEHDGVPYSGVTTAQGFEAPPIPRWVRENHLSLTENGSVPAVLTSELQYTDRDGCPTNVWAVGTRTNSVVPIVNYLRTAVRQTSRVVNTIAQANLRDLIGTSA